MVRAALVCLVAAGCARPKAPTAHTVVWAWERPEDLRAIDPARVGVAWLASTVILRGDGAEVRPRLQPLRVPDGTELTAVVRVEVDRRAERLGDGQRAAVRAEVARLAARSARVQIDFDARKSQRDFYRHLLIELRRALPSRVTLSMTALASWCLDDPWIADLPVDEAVPMLYRLGPARGDVERALGRGFGPRVCRGSVGLATDEPRATSAERVYWFNPKPWNTASLGSLP
jgi:hypothetical protein